MAHIVTMHGAVCTRKGGLVAADLQQKRAGCLLLQQANHN
uniref:Uncharacterized protein n=1 Tax=Rheinheimera sp. BAL341 TaxID=1708203 RepID=A0A486XVE1_9GAMM